MSTPRKPDLAHLERAIRLGSTDAARDAGLTNFTVTVSIEDISGMTAIGVQLVIISPEQAAELLAHQAAEQRKRDDGN